jgi:hypothetical protein
MTLLAGAMHGHAQYCTFQNVDTHGIEVNTLNATCVTTLPTHPTPAAFLECFDNYTFTCRLRWPEKSPGAKPTALLLHT